MSEQELMRLAERCEAATGADRELDAAIARAIGKKHGPADGFSNSENGDYWATEECAATYTSSVDVASTLRPDGWGWLAADQATGVTARVNLGRHQYQSKKAVTPALALCAAALRARAQVQS